MSADTTARRGRGPSSMTPDELLGHADALLATTGMRVAAWPRAAALLTRLALETCLDGYWGQVEPNASRCSVRVQLLILPRYADPATASLARQAWYATCRAVHHHAYELDPTAAELRDTHRAVTRLTELLAPA